MSVRVRGGELVALLGPNGAGKSTLLGVLAGDVVPDAGAVRLDGRAVADWPVRELAMRRSVLLQQVTLSFPFLVEEVLAMGRSVWAGTEAVRAEGPPAAVLEPGLLGEVYAHEVEVIHPTRHRDRAGKP